MYIYSYIFVPFLTIAQIIKRIYFLLSFQVSRCFLYPKMLLCLRAVSTFETRAHFKHTRTLETHNSPTNTNTNTYINICRLNQSINRPGAKS